MMRTVRLIALLVCVAVLASCEHKELCYHHPHSARVRLLVDWSQFAVEQPTGMTAILFPDDGGEAVTSLTNTINYVDISAASGSYTALVFNQSTQEFGSLRFTGMEQYATAAVHANPSASRWYKTRAGETVIMNPEWIGADHLGGIRITADMIEASELMRSTRQAGVPDANIIGVLTPRNLVYTVKVRIHVKGIHNVRSARASLSGMAEGYEFAAARATAETGVQLLEEWSIERDPSDPTQGVLVATIRSFGLPYGHLDAPQSNALDLSLLLVDGKTQKNYSFAVGDRFRVSESLEMELVIEETIGETIPDVKPEGGSAGGFDATVDDWEDAEHIDITM